MYSRHVLFTHFHQTELTQESIPDFRSHYVDMTVACSFIQSNNTHIGRACSDEYIYLAHVFHMPGTTLDVLCSGVPGTTLRFSNPLGLTGLSCSHTHSCFILVEGD